MSEVGTNTKTESEPCHVQLWFALGALESAIDEFRHDYNGLSDTDEPARPVEEKPAVPSFIEVLGKGVQRVAVATESIRQLRADYDRLCLHADKP